jgi:formylglycine-generating enzyme required for sulfatase activity
MIKKVFTIGIFLYVTATGFGQSVTNVRARQEAKKIIVTYDLAGGDANQTYTVKLLVSEDGGSTWTCTLTAVTGDAGTGIKAGYSKQVIWDPLTEPGRDRLQGDRIVFKITAEFTPLPRTTITGGSGLEPEMVFIQGGSFQMGSNDGEDYEKPVHTITLNNFYIGKYEVTQKQWREVMGSDPPELAFKGCDQCPVEGVSWNDIQDFLKKLNIKTGKNYRLPTEAEWEYAARGGSRSRGYTYSGSNTVGDVAWYNKNSGTHPVGQKQPNELGLYDMSGNVWEWCSDWYGWDFYKTSPAIEPKGPSTGSARVDRGGGWGSSAQSCRPSLRDCIAPAGYGNSLGFRLVLVP